MKIKKQSIYNEFDTTDRVLNEIQDISSPAWGNLGYWTDKQSGFIEANEALADYLATAADLNKRNQILDLGFGCGEQLLHWLKNYEVNHISGLNPSQKQFSFAVNKLQMELNKEQRSKVILYNTSAENLLSNFPKERPCFDCILALDSAYHFRSRHKVFAVSRKLLRSGGRLAFTDMLIAANSTSTDKLTRSLPSWFLPLLTLGGVPRSNHKSIKEIERELEICGFNNITTEDITAKVFPGMIGFLEDFIARNRSVYSMKILRRYYLTLFLLRRSWNSGGMRYFVYTCDAS